MNEHIGDERVIPSGWPGQRGGGGSSPGISQGLLLGDFVVSHGVDVEEVVEAEADEDGMDREQSRRDAPQKPYGQCLLI